MIEGDTRMAFQFSRPIEELIEKPTKGDVLAEVDVLIVGSGYGGAVCAMRLCGRMDRGGRDLRVMVLERGKEYHVGEFPNSLGELPGYVRFQRPSDPHPIGYPDALFDLRLGDEVDVLVGSGLGGTSLINANVAARPLLEVFQNGPWPSGFDFGALDEGYKKVEELLGAKSGEAGGSRAKYRAFSKLVDSLGNHDHAGLAKITVTR